MMKDSQKLSVLALKLNKANISGGMVDIWMSLAASMYKIKILAYHHSFIKVCIEFHLHMLFVS